MNIKLDKAIAATVVTALPLLFAVGCAGDAHNLAQTEPDSQQIVESEQSFEQEINSRDVSSAAAIANMDAYMEQLADEPVEEGGMELTEVGAPDMESVQAEPASLGSMTDEELLVAEILGGAGMETNQDDSDVVLPPPQQMVFRFGFDKNELNAADADVVKQHAAYLINNPNITLVINGHTDNHGPKLYNQRLSERRARAVADVLIAAGVPESQLRVDGMGDSVPMVSPENREENRRVEFVYQDSMMAQSH